MDKKTWIWAVVAVVVVVLLVVFMRGGTKEASGEPIKIGAVLSLTGGLQSWGEEARNSIALAVSEINKDGGMNGRQIEMIYEDGKCESAASTAAAQKLITIDKVKTIISFCSLEASTIAPIAEENKVLHLTPTATSPSISTAGDYTFRLAPSDVQPAQALAKILSEKYSRIGIITEVSDFSQAFRDNVLTSLQSQGKAPVFNESFIAGTRDFRSLISKMKETGLDVVVVNANTPVAGGLIMKQMQEQGLSLPRYGIYWGTDPEFLSTAGSAAEGFTFFNFIAPDSDGVKKFKADYKEMFGQEPPNPQFALLSYDGMYVLREAIGKTSWDDSTKVKSRMYEIKNLPVLSGTVSFDENGDSIGIPISLFEVKNGKAEKIN